MLPNGWQSCDSTAIEAFRFIEDRSLLQLVFVDERKQYDYPCTAPMYEQFRAAASKGRYVNQVLKPYAQQLGWSVKPYPSTTW